MLICGVNISIGVDYGGRGINYRGTPFGDGSALCLDQGGGNTGITFIKTH